MSSIICYHNALTPYQPWYATDAIYPYVSTPFNTTPDNNACDPQLELPPVPHTWSCASHVVPCIRFTCTPRTRPACVTCLPVPIHELGVMLTTSTPHHNALAPLYNNCHNNNTLVPYLHIPTAHVQCHFCSIQRASI